MDKFKSCCNSVCLLSTCIVRDNGGCYCQCRLKDYISEAERIITDNGIPGIYYSNREDTKKHLNSLNDEELKERDSYIEECKKFLESELVKKFKTTLKAK